MIMNPSPLSQLRQDTAIRVLASNEVWVSALTRAVENRDWNAVEHALKQLQDSTSAGAEAFDMGSYSPGPKLAWESKAMGIVKKLVEGDDDFLSNFAQEHGSAVDIWGDETLAKEIKALTDQGAQFKSVMWGSDEHEGPAEYHQEVRRLLAKGWKLLRDEDNIDSFEAILYKIGESPWKRHKDGTLR